MHTPARPRAALRRALLPGLVLLLLASGLVLPPTASADEQPQVLLLLDVSGSMAERIPSGGSKFAAAQRALRQVADAVPAGTRVGLRVYGSRIAEPEQRNPRACQDTELVLPVGPLDRRRLDRVVDSFAPRGETPIAYSLQQSVGDLGASGQRVVILISDGEETCTPDPCPTARKLAAAGVDLQFNAIGLTVDAAARRQLQCIAKAGNGTYYDAADTAELTDAVRRLTQRALRPFQTTGTPVEGTVDEAGAPRIGAGQYRDAYDATGTARYYRLQRTPGSTVTASVASIVRPYPTQNTETWALALATPDGTPCATTRATAGGYRATTVLSGAVSATQVDPVMRSPAPPTCTSEPELLLSLSRTSSLGNEDDVPVEVLVAEEPPIEDLAGLPAAVDDYDGAAGAVRPAGRVVSRLGGTAFSNAAAVEPGTWRDAVAAGETVFYRTRLEAGQRLRVSADTPAPRSTWQLAAAEAVTARVDVYSPARVSLAHRAAVVQGRVAARTTVGSPVVRVRNRDVPPPASYLEPNVTTAAVAGDYFVSVQVDPLQDYLSGRVMPVRLSLAVDGRASGQPTYRTVTATPTAGPTAGPTPSGTAGATAETLPADGGAPSLPGWLLPAGAALLAAGVVVGVVVGGRARSGSRTSTRR